MVVGLRRRTPVPRVDPPHRPGTRRRRAGLGLNARSCHTRAAPRSWQPRTEDGEGFLLADARTTPCSRTNANASSAFASFVMRPDDQVNGRAGTSVNELARDTPAPGYDKFLERSSDMDGSVVVSAVDSEAGVKIHRQRTVVILRIRSGTGKGRGLGDHKALLFQPGTGGMKQCLGDTRAAMRLGDDEARDLAHSFGVGIGLVGEGVEQLARSSVAPPDGLAIPIREVTLHSIRADAFAGLITILARRPFRPDNLRVIDVEELAVAGAPPRIVSEGRPFEIGEEVGESLRRQSADLDGWQIGRHVCV